MKHGGSAGKISAFGLALAAALLGPATGSEAFQGYDLLTFDGHLVKWGEPAAGRGATVRYALAGHELSFPDARNCRAMVPLNGLLARSGLATAAFEAELSAALAMWERAANIRFLRAGPGERADITFGGQAVPRGVAYTDVAYDRNGSEPHDVRAIERSLVCLNPTRLWKIGFGGDPEVYDLRYALAHEIGHAIGLDHPGPKGQLMSFSYTESFRKPQAGDVGGVVALYGSRQPMPAIASQPPEPAPAPAPQPAPAKDTPDTALR